MADYKGLTIRIGGDTSKLTNALKTSQSAAANLQKQLRQVTRALSFDAGNIKNATLKMEVLQDRTESLYAKADLLKTAYKQLGDEIVQFGGKSQTVRELAEGTDNVALAASTAKTRYTELTRSLATAYREIERIAKANGEEVTLSVKDRPEEIDRMLQSLKGIDAEMDEHISKAQHMRSVWDEVETEFKSMEKAAQFDAMNVDIARFEAEAKDAARQVGELSRMSKLARENFEGIDDKIRQADTVMDELAKDTQAFESALRSDPSSMEAAIGRLKSMAQQIDVAEDKASLLREKMAAYPPEVQKAIEEHKNLKQWVEAVRQEHDSVNTELSQEQAHLKNLEATMRRMKDASNGTDEEFEELTAEIREATTRADNLRQKLRETSKAADTANMVSEYKQYEKQLTETTAKQEALTEAMEQTSLSGAHTSMFNPSTMKSLGMTLYSTVTPAVTMVGYRMISAAEEIDSAYRNMRKTVAGTESDYKALYDAAIEFSTTHVTSADQILEIEAIGGELGIATENLRTFAETVSNIDVATNLGAEEAATYLGQLANITHMGADEYEGYADALVRLGNNGASTEVQISEIANRIGSMGTIVGLSVPEILALSSSIASTGQKSEAAGTAISNTLADMESAVANGGDKLQQFADVAGMTAEEFAATWEDKPIEAFEAFIKGLNGIEENGGSATATLEGMGITGTRQIQAIEGLMQTVGGLDDNLTMANDAFEGTSDIWGEAGDAAREAERKAEGFSGQLQILKNIANDAMAELAEGAVPILQDLTGIAQDAMTAFKKMGINSKKAIIEIAAIGAISGPMLTFAATVLTAKDNVMKWAKESTVMSRAIKLFNAGLDEGATKGQALRATFKDLGKSMVKNLAVAGVVAAIAIIAYSIGDLIKYHKNLKDASADAGDAVSAAIGGIAARSESSYGKARDAMREYVDAAAEANRELYDLAEETWGDVALIENYRDTLIETFNAYNDGSDTSAEALGTLRSSLEGFNELTGESITLTEDENGKLVLMRDGAELAADAFKRLGDMKIYAAKADYYSQGYETAFGNLQAAEAELAAAEASLKAMEQTPELYTAEDFAAMQDIVDGWQGKVDEARGTMEQYDAEVVLMAEAAEEGASALTKLLADNDHLRASIENSGASVLDFKGHIEALGISTDTLNKLNEDGVPLVEELGYAYDGTAASIVEGMLQAGETVDDAMLSTAGLRREIKEIDGKSVTFYVDDNGTIMTEDGHVYDLKGDLSSIPSEIITAFSADPASNTQSTAEDTEDAVESVPTTWTTTFSVNNSSALSGIQSVIDKLKELATRSYGNGITVGGYSYSYGPYSATGSYSNGPYIPRHAAGYIATGPTLTNRGWVGEAGAEAVLNWGTGGVVVPLTNTRYMEPIAHAIAAEMPTSQGNVSVYIDGARINDYPAIRDATKNYLIELHRESVL